METDFNKYYVSDLSVRVRIRVDTIYRGGQAPYRPVRCVPWLCVTFCRQNLRHQHGLATWPPPSACGRPVLRCGRLFTGMDFPSYVPRANSDIADSKARSKGEDGWIVCRFLLTFQADMSAWNYVVTAHKPTNVTHSVVGNFTGPSELNLIIAYPYTSSRLARVAAHRFWICARVGLR